MILSLFISLVLCLKCTLFIAGAVLLTVRNWSSQYDRPFHMGHVEDELSLVISTKIIINCGSIIISEIINLVCGLIGDGP
jgi:hypothetical protein